MHSQRVIDTLAWFDVKSATVADHDGVAFTELEILKIIANATPSSGAGILGDAYAQEARRGAGHYPNRNDVYRFTHQIMFATNFGRQELVGIDQTGYGELIETLCAEHATDTDLLGELLICAKCIGYWSASMDAAMVSFTSQFDALDRGDFNGSYHPILIGAILFAME